MDEIDIRKALEGWMPDTCPTCGSRVRVVGNVTMHYEPAAYTLGLTPPAQAAAKSAGGTCRCHWCRVAQAAAESAGG